MLKTFLVESVGDASSGLYHWNGKRYVLKAIVNEDSAKRFSHPWPETATKKAVAQWAGRCTMHPVTLVGGIDD